MLLCEHGFSADYIYNRCTFGAFAAYVATAMKREFESAERQAIALQMAISALFSKEGGAAAQKLTKEIKEQLIDVQRKAMGAEDEDRQKIAHEVQLLDQEIARFESENISPHESKRRALRAALALDMAFKKLTHTGATLPTLQSVNHPGMVQQPMQEYERSLDTLVDRLMAQNDKIAERWQIEKRNREILAQTRTNKKKSAKKAPKSSTSGW